MNTEQYLFYFYKDDKNEIKCKSKLGKRHIDCIEELRSYINIDINDNNIETMIIKMLEKGYLCLMFFGATYLFLPNIDELNEFQIKFLQSIDMETVLKVKGYAMKKPLYPGRFIDYQIEYKLLGKDISNKEIISDLLIKKEKLF